MQFEPTDGAPASPEGRFRARGLARAACAVLVAIFAFAVASSPAAAADPALTVDKATDLRTGAQITVSGTDFAPVTKERNEDGPENPPFPLQGLYIAQAALSGTDYVIGAGQQWISEVGTTPETTLNPDGSFVSELTVSKKIGSGEGVVDCTEVQCFVLAWQAHGPVGSPWTPVFARYDIEFDASGRIVSLDPRTGLSPTQQSTVSVAGFNFDLADAPSGFNVAQAQLAGDDYRYGSPLLVKTGADPAAENEVELSPSGAFLAKLKVSAKQSATGGDIDCEFVSCSIIIWPAGEEPVGGASTNVLENESISFAFKYSPKVKLSQSRHLPSEAEVTVEGSAFPAGDPGLYVAQAVWIDGELLTVADDRSGASSGVKFVRPGSSTADTKLNPDGTFSTTISVARNLTLDSGQKIDCVEADCSIITWRAHSNPSRHTLYTDSALSFEEDAPSEAPRANVVKKKQFRIGRKAKTIRLAAVVCNSSRCTVKKPKRAVLRVGKRKFALKVGGPAKLTQGKRGVIRLRVRGKVAKKLAGRKGRVKFNVVIRSEAGNKRVKINKVLVGAKKGKAKRAGRGK